MGEFMFEKIIEPRFSETDALGHINNSVFFSWCELARVPIFKIFTPDMDPHKWELIIARNEMDYLKEVLLTPEVLIKTYLSRIGNSSMTIEHEIFQNLEKVGHCKTIMIRYDYSKKKSIPLEIQHREALESHLISPKI